VTRNDESVAHSNFAVSDYRIYKIYLTEACDDGAPRLITHVETTTAPVVDAAVLPAVHQVLHGRELLPAVQLMDSGASMRLRSSPRIRITRSPCADRRAE